MVHLEKFGFEWEDTSLEFKSFVKFSTDKKNELGALLQIPQAEKTLDYLCLDTFGSMA